MQSGAGFLTLGRLVIASALAGCCALVGAQIPAPERYAKNNVLISDRDPAIRIDLPAAVQYVGAERWTLFGIADCEVHVFVEAGENKIVQRLYWQQFVPSQPELKHTYKFLRKDTLSGMAFDVRAQFGSGQEVAKPGSDLEHVQSLLKNKGYQLPENMMNVRLVHLLDAGARKELMVIYAEDMKPTGLTAEDLKPQGGSSAAWPAIEKGLTERAEARVLFRPTAGP